jgi:hypothetical protein
MVLVPDVDDTEEWAQFVGEHKAATEGLAKARAAGAAEARARIVAMMRADAALWPDDSKTNGAMLYLADRIERGET